MSRVGMSRASAPIEAVWHASGPSDVYWLAFKRRGEIASVNWSSEGDSRELRRWVDEPDMPGMVGLSAPELRELGEALVEMADQMEGA